MMNDDDDDDDLLLVMVVVVVVITVLLSLCRSSDLHTYGDDNDRLVHSRVFFLRGSFSYSS